MTHLLAIWRPLATKQELPRALFISAIAALLSACVGGTASGGGGGVASDGSAAQDTTGDGGGGGGGGGGKGDATKNTASVQAKDPDGAATKVEAAEPADPNKTKVFGAANADKILQLYIADAAGVTIVATIDTAVHALPKKGIPVTEQGGAAWVVYTNQGAVLITKAKGTIDIDGCPTKSGEVVHGAFKGVEVVNPVAGLPPATLTLDGPFNLVYQGGSGAIACTPPTTGGGGGTTDLGSFGKPKGATCDANPCDGGSNKTRNCCPYVPCMEPCFSKCAFDVQVCAAACGGDFSCFTGCQAKIVTCVNGCLTSCNVSQPCKTAIAALQSCEEQQAETCDTGSEEGDDACSFDACCGQWKSAF